MSHQAKTPSNKFLSLLYPKRCPYCYSIINKEKSVCEKCEKDIYTLGVSLGVSGYRCCSPLLYKGKFKRAVIMFKFKSKPHMSQPFSELIFEQIKRSYEDYIFDYITYVPMHRKDEKKRGYNQSQLLAKNLSQLMGIPCVDTLIKIKRTKPQHKLDAKTRRTNLKGAFKIKDKTPIKGKSILIIDDIITTGSTLSECAKTLEKEKPSHICCATLLSTANLY